MIEKSIQPTKPVNEKYIEQVCVDLGLSVTMKGELKGMAPNTHWHYKLGQQKGVLEITLIHGNNTVLLQCKENRQADWIFDAIPVVEKKLNSKI